MKNKPILIVLTLFFMANAKALAQDVVFSQWENMPIYYNPALTGDFDGLLRLRAKYRNQWASLLGDNSYKTSAVSAEYKLSKGSVRKISVGAFAIHDKAGSLDFRNTSFNFSSSVIQYLGNPDHLHHSIGFGLNVGLATSKLDLENGQWPGMAPEDINDKTSFADVSGGLLWQYKSNTHFTFQIGGALHHLNRANVSFFDSSVVKLNHRFNLHGHIEIPLVKKLSIIPSFLLWSQGPTEQLLFGLNNRWYLNSPDQNFVQLGLFAKRSNDYYGNAIYNYVLSATVEIKSFLLGFSFDRFSDINSNAYEFSVGYIFGMKGAKDATGNINYAPPGIAGRT